MTATLGEQNGEARYYFNASDAEAELESIKEELAEIRHKLETPQEQVSHNNLEFLDNEDFWKLKHAISSQFTHLSAKPYYRKPPAVILPEPLPST